MRSSSARTTLLALACSLGLTLVHAAAEHHTVLLGGPPPRLFPAFAIAIGIAVIGGWRWSSCLLIAVALAPQLIHFLGKAGGGASGVSVVPWFGGGHPLAGPLEALALATGVLVASLFQRRSRGCLVFRFQPAELLRLLFGAVVCGPLVASLLLLGGGVLLGERFSVDVLAALWSALAVSSLLVVPAILAWRPYAAPIVLSEERLSPLLATGAAVLMLGSLRASELSTEAFWQVGVLGLLVGSAAWGTVRAHTGLTVALAFWLVLAAVRPGAGWLSLEDSSQFSRALSDLGLIALGSLIVLVVRVELRSRADRLLGQRRLLETVVDHIPGAISLRDARGRLLFANRFARQRSDLSREEISEHTYDGPSQFRQRGARSSSSPPEPRSEVSSQDAAWHDGELIDESGQALPVLQTELPVPGEKDDEGCNTLTIALDASGQRRAEAAVRASQAELTALLRSIPGTVMRISEQHEVLLSSDPADDARRGKALEEWFHIEDRPLIAAAFERMETVAAEVTEQVELRRVDPPHERVEVRLTHLQEWDQTAAPPGFTAVMQSVESLRAAEHERRGLQREMDRVARLESLGFLAGGLAHDFNNLLTGIMGNTQLAAEAIRDPGALALLDDAQVGAQRAAELCRQLLVYAGRGKLQVGPVHISQVVQEILRPIQPRLSPRAQLMVELRDDLPAIEGDAMRIQQVAMNLIANASDALPRGVGRIEVATGCRGWSQQELKRARISRRLAAAEYVSLWVRDDGGGISQEDLERIFEPFFTTKSAGTGLGLAAARGMVHSLGGAIRVESERGSGTCFELLFPSRRDLELPHGGPSVHTQVAAHHEGRVLVVDDEILVRNLAKVALSKAGFEVILASDGVEALTWLETEVARRAASSTADTRQASNAHGLACVVLDLTMPRLSGEGLAQNLLLRWPELPIVLASGYTHERLGRALRKLPFLAKPFRGDELVRAVEAAGRRRGSAARGRAVDEEPPPGRSQRRGGC